MGVRRKIPLLLVITLLVYGPASAYFLSDPDQEYDYNIYRSRTQTIIDGGLLYKDVHTETPPLVAYIMVPAQLMGGDDNAYVWGAYEAAFAFLLACLLYLGMRRSDDAKAFYVGVVALLCPFLIMESAVGEDGAIVAFMFFAGAVAMLHDRRYAPVAIALGIWTKMWPVLLLPVEFLRARGWKKKTEVAVLAVVVTLAVTLPFLILCFDEFVEFLSFYFLGDPSRPSGGRSMWNFLRDGGYGVPEIVELALVLGSLLAAYLYAQFKHWHSWKAASLAMLMFIVFYPKMHLGYYVMPFVLLSVWAVGNWKVAARLFLAYVPITLSGSFAADNYSPLVASSDGGWLFGFLLVLLGTVLICDAARIAFKSDAFITRSDSTEGAVL
jgi:hypothetical protein